MRKCFCISIINKILIRPLFSYCYFTMLIMIKSWLNLFYYCCKTRLMLVLIIIYKYIFFLGNFGAKKCVKSSTNVFRSPCVKFSPVSSPCKSDKPNKYQNHNIANRRRSSDAKDTRTVDLNEYDHFCRFILIIDHECVLWNLLNVSTSLIPRITISETSLLERVLMRLNAWC